MEAIKHILNEINQRIDTLEERREILLQGASIDAFGKDVDVKPIIRDTEAKIQELHVMHSIVAHYYNDTTEGPKVVGKIALGNIEECFQEDAIREIEEDFFEGY